MANKIAVNVKLRVGPILRETVILPNQRAKRLSNLIVLLLEGYRDNAYIRQYIDGTLTNEPAQAQLLKEIEDAEKKLSSLLTEESPQDFEARLKDLEERVARLERREPAPVVEPVVPEPPAPSPAPAVEPAVPEPPAPSPAPDEDSWFEPSSDNFDSLFDSIAGL